MTSPAPIVLGDNVVYALPLAGGGVLLVDAGPDYDDGERGPSWEQAVEQARAHGFAPGDVRAVLVTHAHIDHAGLAARWAGYGAAVFAGAADRPALLAGREGNERQRGPRLAALRRHGCPAEVVERLAALRGRRGLRWDPCVPPLVEPVRDGHEFPLEGGATLRVLDAPGHTPGNLVAFVPERAELYTGDTLLPTTIPTPGLHFPAAVERREGQRWPSLPPFLRSVARLKVMGARRVYPGHGPPVDDPARLFERWEEHHRRRAARVRQALAGRGPSGAGVRSLILRQAQDEREGMSSGKTEGGGSGRATEDSAAGVEGVGEDGLTAYEVARQLFARLPEQRMGQAMTEVIGHLDVLEERGEAEAHESAGVLRYRWRHRE